MKRQIEQEGFNNVCSDYFFGQGRCVTNNLRCCKSQKATEYHVADPHQTPRLKPDLDDLVHRALENTASFGLGF